MVLFMQKIFSLIKKLYLPLIFALAAICLGQYFSLSAKKEEIEYLVARNHELSEKNSGIISSIEKLSEDQENIISMQKELGNVLNKMETLPVIKFIKHNIKNTSEKIISLNDLENNKEAALTKLDFLIESSKNENSFLLAKALSMKNVLSNLPTLWPSSGYISSRFGYRNDPFTGKKKYHKGVDFAGGYGTPVYAPADGVVITAKHNRDFGRMVELKHHHGIVTRYAHLSEFLVFNEQKIKKGQVIGRVGNSGRRCAGTHLHYEIRQGNRLLNPSHFLLQKNPKEQERFF